MYTHVCRHVYRHVRKRVQTRTRKMCADVCAPLSDVAPWSPTHHLVRPAEPRAAARDPSAFDLQSLVVVARRSVVSRPFCREGLTPHAPPERRTTAVSAMHHARSCVLPFGHRDHTRVTTTARTIHAAASARGGVSPVCHLVVLFLRLPQDAIQPQRRAWLKHFTKTEARPSQPVDFRIHTMHFLL